MLAREEVVKDGDSSKVMNSKQRDFIDSNTCVSFMTDKPPSNNTGCEADSY